jgi:hypothetical protein
MTRSTTEALSGAKGPMDEFIDSIDDCLTPDEEDSEEAEEAVEIEEDEESDEDND